MSAPHKRPAAGATGTVAGNGRESDPRSLRPLDWWALGLLLAALFFAPLLAGQFATPAHFAFAFDESLFATLQGVGIPIVLACVAAGFGLFAYREMRRPVAIGGVPGLGAAATIAVLWAAVSLIRARPIFLGVNAYACFVAAVVMAGALSRLMRDRRAMAAAILVVAAAATITAGAGVHEYLGYWRDGVRDHRTFATYLNPDFLAGYLALTIPITMAAVAEARERLLAIALGIGAALQSSCALLTGSRAGVAIMALGVLIWIVLSMLSGAIVGAGRRVGAALALFVAAALLASAPTLVRVTGPSGAAGAAGKGGAIANAEAVAAAQSYSGAFRTWTWRGAVRMAEANPALGTGLGTFEAAFPKYTETAFTAHAHNGFLQWAAETGMPGVLALLSAVAAATAFAAYVLLVLSRREEPLPVLAGGPAVKLRMVTDEQDAIDDETPLMFGPGRIILAGVLAGIAASLLHNLVDSDWYVVGTGFTVAAALALCVAYARDTAPLATQTPRRLAAGITAAGIAGALFITWRAVSLAGAYLASNQGAELASQERRPVAALEAFRSAASWDPLDPEPLLDEASIESGLGRSEEAKLALQRAAEIAPTGKTFYRLGRLYQQAGNLSLAERAFEHARVLEPRNLQNLRALGDALAADHKPAAAETAYRSITALEHQPFGTVRAVPEKVETDFAYAHAAIGDLKSEADDNAAAATEYRAALAVLKEYWPTRNLLINDTVPAEKKVKLADLYDDTCTKLQAVLRKLGTGNQQEIGELAHLQQKIRTQRAEDNAAAGTDG